jgi:[protein-PII] uridylyltransferase
MDSFTRKLRSAFQTYALEDVRLVSEVKLLLEARREILFCELVPDGLSLARGLAEIMDALLATYLDADETGAGIALVALGGYGRGELNPHSDIDVMVLFPDGAEERAEEFAGPLLAFLWDLSHTVGHSTRSLSGCREWMEKDLPSATALLEGRFLAGSRALFRQFRERVTDPWLYANRTACIEKKVEEAHARHRFYGESPRLLAPNVKESPGALRDMHVAGWIAQALSGRKDFRVYRDAGLLAPDETADLVRAYSEIHAVRNSLHLLTGKKQDTLDPWARKEAGESMGFLDGGGMASWERFMRFYYEAAVSLHRFLLRVIRFVAGGRADVPRRDIGDRLVAVGDEAFPAGEGDPGTPIDALVLLADAAERGLAPSPEMEDALRRVVPSIDAAVRSNPAGAAAFLRILARSDASRTLRALERSGFLGEYVPEFGRLACLIREDPVHQYTVDEHTLRTVEALDAFADSDRREALLRIDRPELLRLSLLLHDAGKVRARDHRTASVGMVPDATGRLGLSEEDARLVRFLVESHDLMTGLADRRVPAEAADELARAVPDRDRLRSLYLMTLADVAAVGQGAFSGWREAQLDRLFDDAMSRLSPEDRVPFADRVIEAVGTDRADEVREHLDAMGARYALEIDPSRAVLHLDLIARLGEDEAALTSIPGDGFSEVWIAVADAPGRLAELSGVLTVNDLDIRTAHLYTRADGVAVDGFVVTPCGDAKEGGEEFWRKVATDLAAMVRGDLDIDEAVARHRERFRPAAPTAGEAEPTPGVVWRDRVSERHSVVELTARDRPGLLHDVARIFAAHGFSIDHAIAATGGAIVTDTFYVARTGGSGADALVRALTDLVADDADES